MPPRKLGPVHPGDILKHDFLTPLGLSAYRVARDDGVSLPTVNDIVRRRRAVTAEMALRFARYFGTSAELWQSLQAQYDLEVAQARIGTTVARDIRPFAPPSATEPARRRAAA
jgi:addiction module HigA family antidote